MQQNYSTTELEIGSFLKAMGYKLVAANPRGRFVAFSFERSAAEAVGAYFGGAEVPARALFEAHRSLRAMIKQVNEYESQRTGEQSQCQRHKP